METSITCLISSQTFLQYWSALALAIGSLYYCTNLFGWGWLKTIQKRHGILTGFLNIMTSARYYPDLNDKIRRADQKLY